ncbi:MAG: 30S ribosomal protein S6 [Minisyncoccia bacterium]
MEQEIKKENYEIAFWVKDENDKPVKDILKKRGAEVMKEKPILKMRLAFPIRKENFAFLGTIVFSAGPEVVDALKADLNLEGAILRYFLRRAKKDALVEKPAGENIEGQSRERKPFFRFRNEVKKVDGVLTNEALEKKIEEILQ